MSSSKAPFSAINFDKKCKKCHWIVISSILLSNLIKYLALIHTIFIFYAIFKLHALENILYQKSIFPIGSEQPNKKTHISILSISFRFVRSEWWKYIAKCLRVSMEWVTVFRDTASDPYSPPPLSTSIFFNRFPFKSIPASGFVAPIVNVLWMKYSTRFSSPKYFHGCVLFPLSVVNFRMLSQNPNTHQNRHKIEEAKETIEKYACTIKRPIPRCWHFNVSLLVILYIYIFFVSLPIFLVCGFCRTICCLVLENMFYYLLFILWERIDISPWFTHDIRARTHTTTTKCNAESHQTSDSQSKRVKRDEKRNRRRKPTNMTSKQETIRIQDGRGENTWTTISPTESEWRRKSINHVLRWFYLIVIALLEMLNTTRRQKIERMP